MKKPQINIAQIKEAISNILWVYKLYLRLAKRDVLIVNGIQLTLAVISPLQAYMAGKIVDALVHQSEYGLDGFQFTIHNQLVFYTLALSLVLLVTYVMDSTRRYFQERIHIYPKFEIRQIFFEKLGRLDLQQYENAKLASQIQLGRNEYTELNATLQVTLKFLTNSIRAIVSFIILTALSPILSIFITIAVLPQMFLYLHQTNRDLELQQKLSKKFRHLWMLFGSMENERNIPEHNISHGELHLSDQARSLLHKIAQQYIKVVRHTFREDVLVDTGTVISRLFTDVFLIYLVLTGRLTLGQFTFYRSQAKSLDGRLFELSNNVAQISGIAKKVGYVRQIMELPPAIKSGDKHIDTSRPPEIEFRNVSFKYPQSDRPVLKNISFTIKPYEKISIVGANGAGKTTLIKLLLRFYDPTDGQILIDGVPLNELDLREYRNMIGTLFQEFNVYDALDIKNNLAIARPMETLNRDRLVDSLKRAEAWEFVEKLPNGLNQKLSKQLDGGTKLSGGEWQKLAIARMFYRDPQILILDEPTAAIDAVAESKIFSNIYKEIRNKSLIIISHRFSTVRMADKIYVMEHGRIAESGTHDELLAKQGLYHKSFTLQAKGYG